MNRPMTHSGRLESKGFLTIDVNKHQGVASLVSLWAIP